MIARIVDNDIAVVAIALWAVVSTIVTAFIIVPLVAS